MKSNVHFLYCPLIKMPGYDAGDIFWQSIHFVPVLTEKANRFCSFLRAVFVVPLGDFRTFSMSGSIIQLLFLSMFCCPILLSSVQAQESEALEDIHSYFGGLDYISDIHFTDSLKALKRVSRKKKKVKNTLGTYSATMVLQKSKSFNGANCNPTQSFPASISVTGTKKKPVAQLGNVPISFVGGANAKGAKLKGTYSNGGINRKYTLLFRKVKTTSAKITLTELVKSGTIKACLFKHSALFSRVK